MRSYHSNLSKQPVTHLTAAQSHLLAVSHTCRLRHQQRVQKGQRSIANSVPRESAATASRNKVMSKSLKISRASGGAHSFAVNVCAHRRKRAQISDPLGVVAAIKTRHPPNALRARHETPSIKELGRHFGEATPQQHHHV